MQVGGAIERPIGHTILTSGTWDGEGSWKAVFGYIWAPVPLDVFSDPPWAYTIRVISPAGEYLGDTFLPCIEGLEPSYSISQGYIMYSYMDVNTGVPSISLFRISSARAGLDYPH